MDEFILDDDLFFTEIAPKGWADYFSLKLGSRRLNEIMSRMHIKESSQYRMKDLAKIVIGSADVLRYDMLEVMQGELPGFLSDELMLKIAKYSVPEDLPVELFDQLYLAISKPFGQDLKFDTKRSSLEQEIHKITHFAFSCFKYDPYWFAKQRMSVWLQSHNLNQIHYYERLAGFYVACEDLQVGTYLPAPIVNGQKQYYRITAHLVTGEGQICMILVPATKYMSLKKLRVTRGSPSPPGGLDFLSYLMTDMEPEIGRIGYESGLYYQKTIDEVVGKIDEEIGYSIGGTIAQWRISDNPRDLTSLWLYKSPGVPKSVWENFNKGVKSRADPLNLYIFQAKGDIVNLAGDVPLGYLAPDPVNVSLYTLNIPKLNPHRYSFIDPDKITVEEIESLYIDQYLSKKSKAFFEKQRKILGKNIVLPAARFFKKVFGKKISKRVDSLRGLKYEDVGERSDQYKINHLENRH